MKILIYGAGVVGCTYGWQLSKVGCEVSVLVNPTRKLDIEQSGINISCCDYRGVVKKDEQVIFKPLVVDCLCSDNNYEYIIVSAKNNNLQDIVPILSKSAGRAHIVFFQNIWDDFDLISKYLHPEQYFFGFPFMVGGTRDHSGIKSVISGIKQSCTPLGELNGQVTPRLSKISKLLDSSQLKPLILRDIKTWLITHYAVAAGLSAGIMSAGNGTNFTRDQLTLKLTIKAMREGLRVCDKRGFNSRKYKENKFYFLPLWLVLPIAKKIYSNEALCSMFDGHINHSSDEIKQMISEVINWGDKLEVDVSSLKILESYI